MMIVRISEYQGTGVASFDCGEEDLNVFLSNFALQNERKGIGRTYLGIEDGDILGFFTLSAAEICCAELPQAMKRGLPAYPVPAIRIARLGVAKAKQGQGYGALLLRAALSRSTLVSDSIGANLVIVDAKHSATSFYEHYGFVKILGDTNTYVLPIATIKKAFGW